MISYRSIVYPFAGIIFSGKPSVILNLVQNLCEGDPEIVDPELDSGHGSG